MAEIIDADFIEIEELSNGYRSIASDHRFIKEVTFYKKFAMLGSLWIVPYMWSFNSYVIKVF